MNIDALNIIFVGDLPLGQKVKVARVAKGLRQSDLAYLADVPTPAIGDLEKGRSVSRWKLRRILKALDLADA